VLNRQKTLLYILRCADKPLERIVLTKFAFLLKYESSSKGGNAFYDFVPYKYGPFSFNIYHELNKLEQAGFVNFTDSQKIILDKNKTEDIPSISNDIQSDILALKKEYTFDKSSLIDHVYKNYPWFTINSEIQKNQDRYVGDIAIYTAGYEGLQIDNFLNSLLENGIQRIIDVRKNPIARRYGFHGSTIKRLAIKLDIDYVHFPELGINGELRQNLISYNDYEELFKQYEKTILNDNKTAIKKILSLMSEKPSVLVCQESDPRFCHRSILANELKNISAFEIKHISGKSCKQNQSEQRFL